MANLSDRLKDAFLVESEQGSSEPSEETSITIGEFVDRLETIADAAEQIVRLRKDLAVLRKSGLTDSDVVALLYGRNSQLNKGDIEAVLETLDEIDEKLRSTPGVQRDLLKRLVSSMERSLKLEDVKETFDELKRLHDQYA